VDLMDMDSPVQKEEEAEKMETDEKEEVVEEKKKKTTKKSPEPQFEMLSNLSRVVPEQLKYITFPAGSRYAPIKRVQFGLIKANLSLPVVY
jgi:26S proteasome regulatory subunit N2